MGERDEQSVSRDSVNTNTYLHIMKLECTTIFYMKMLYITADKKLAFLKEE